MRETVVKESFARFVLGVGVPAAAVAAVVVSYAVTRSGLPDRLATHFDGSGTPDGSMTPTAFLAITLVMTLVGAAALVGLARSRKSLPGGIAPIVGFLGGFFAGLGAAIAAVTFVTQRGIESWEEADGVLLLIAIPLVVSIAVGALAARVASALPVDESAAYDGDRPVMDLAAGEHAVWSQTLHSVPMARFGVLAIVVGVAVAIGTFWWLLLPSLFTGIVLLALATLQVRADRSGLHVKYGLLPWPQTHVAVDRIRSASVIDVRPMQWGGWGYRGSLKLMKQAAVVHRAGPGIRLDLHDGKIFVVTVDDPETPVALLNAEIHRSPQPAQPA